MQGVAGELSSLVHAVGSTALQLKNAARVARIRTPELVNLFDCIKPALQLVVGQDGMCISMYD